MMSSSTRIHVRSVTLVCLIVLLGACGGGGDNASITGSAAGSFGSVEGGGAFTTGQTATMAVQVIGDSSQFSLQWYKDSVAVTDNSRIDGSQTNGLAIANLQPSDSGSYRLALTDSSTTIWSPVVSVSVEAAATNNAPNAFAQTVSTSEDVEVQITLTGDDGESSSSPNLTYILTTLSASGTVSLTSGGAAISSGLPLTLSGPTLFYTPGSGFSGTDTFRFQVQDDGGTANGGVDLSAEATITINVSAGPPVNNAPNADAQWLSTSIDIEVQVTLTGDDGESPSSSQNLTYILSTLPTSGTVSLTSGGAAISSGLPLTLSSPTLFYTPGSGFSGTDTFRFQVQDDGGTANGGVDLSAEATITINVTAPTVGWTTLTPSADTLIYYVSNSGGNDANDGLSTSSPIKTLAKGMSLLQDGYPDWLLLKKGDTWSNEGFNLWTRSGRSPSEPMLISSYGASTARPIVTGSGLRTDFIQVDNLSIVGLHFQSPGFTGADGQEKSGLRFLGYNNDILVEDCMFEVSRFSFQDFYGPISNVSIRRCVVIDSFNVGAHAVGLFAIGVTNLLIEENVFDHNGWNDAIVGAEPTIFNHNVYLNINNLGTIFRGNISSRASSHGLQARTGGIVEDNLFVRNPIALLYGASDKIQVGGISGTVVRNVVLEGNDITSTNKRGWGFGFNNINPTLGVVIADNIVAHNISAVRWGSAFDFVGNVEFNTHNVLLENNIVYDWYTPLKLSFDLGTYLSNITVRNNQFQSIDTSRPIVLMRNYDGNLITFSGNTYHSNKPTNGWFTTNNEGTYMSYTEWVNLTGETGSQARQIPYVDPNRDLGTYHASLGKTGTFEAFIAEARLQSKTNWRTEYTAVAVNAYIRAGFTE